MHASSLASSLFTPLSALLSAALFALMFSLPIASADDKPAVKERYFEMRTYISNDGKFDALHARFRDHTNKLFIKHGMQIIGYWVPADGEDAKNTLIYILAYPSKEARDASWKAFINDPDWKKAKADSEVNGGLVKQIITKFLSPTDYSPIK